MKMKDSKLEIKQVFLAISIFSVTAMGCVGSVDSAQQHPEDLVLIEFAARLESDYHRLHPISGGHSKKIKSRDLNYPQSDSMVGSEEPHLVDEE